MLICLPVNVSERGSTFPTWHVMWCDGDDVRLLFYRSNTKRNVNHLSCYYHQEPSSGASCVDCNEQQDVGHQFNRPVVCWPASWQGNDMMKIHTHHTLLPCLILSDHLAVSYRHVGCVCGGVIFFFFCCYIFIYHLYFILSISKQNQTCLLKVWNAYYLILS